MFRINDRYQATDIFSLFLFYSDVGFDLIQPPV